MGNQAPLSNADKLKFVTLFAGPPEWLIEKGNRIPFFNADEEEAPKSFYVQKPGRIVNHENQYIIYKK